MLRLLGKKDGLLFSPPRDEFNRTLLHWAVYHGEIDIFEQLLDSFDKGRLSVEDMLSKDSNGRNAIHIAVQVAIKYKELDYLSELLKYRLFRDVFTEKDSYGESPLDIVLKEGNDSVIELVQSRLSVDRPVDLKEKQEDIEREKDIDKGLARLEKRVQARLSAIDDRVVRTRDIFVSQWREGEPLMGEFDTPRGSAPPPVGEPKKEVIKRITSHIARVAEIAKRQHLNDNFPEGNNEGMKPGSENNITRLIFNEFSFYPHETHGPFSEKDFRLIVDNLVKIGKKLPPNMQLMLGSFPVVDKEGNIHNVVCQIQCLGKDQEPLVAAFAKAIPSNIDPVYRDKQGRFYKNAYITSGSNLNKFEEDVVSPALRDLIWGLEKSPLDRTSLKESVDEAIKLCRSYPEFPLPSSLLSLVERLEQLKDKLEKESKDEEVIKMRDGIEAERDRFVDDIRKRQSENEDFAAKYANSPIITMNQRHGGWAYGGNLRCVTQGGIEFISALDICFDHIKGVAKKSYKRDLEKDRQRLEQARPHVVAHTIVSSRGNPEPDSILGKSYAQADADREVTGVGKLDDYTEERPKPDAPEKTVSITDADFGYAAEVHISQQRMLDRLTGQLGESITEHNKLFVKIEALRLYANQHPNDLEAINKRLIDLIIETAIERNKADGLLLAQTKDQIKPVIQKQLARKNIQVDSPKLGEYIKLAQDLLALYSKKERDFERKREMEREEQDFEHERKQEIEEEEIDSEFVEEFEKLIQEVARKGSPLLFSQKAQKTSELEDIDEDVLQEAQRLSNPKARRRGKKYEDFKKKLGFGALEDIVGVSGDKIKVRSQDSGKVEDYSLKKRYAQYSKRSIKKLSKPS